MVQLICGDGKGKTTAAVGGAVRMAGAGGKVLFAQFYKNADSSEVEILKNIPGITYMHPDIHYELFQNYNEETMKDVNEKYLLSIKHIMENADDFDMIVLDEIVYAYMGNVFSSDSDKDISKKDFLNWLKIVGKDKEIVLTGRGPDKALMDVCNYVSEIKMVKHPYTMGVTARKGIEF